MVLDGIVGVAERVGVSKDLSKKEDVCLRSITFTQYRQRWTPAPRRTTFPCPYASSLLRTRRG